MHQKLLCFFFLCFLNKANATSVSSSEESILSIDKREHTPTPMWQGDVWLEVFRISAFPFRFTSYVTLA